MYKLIIVMICFVQTLLAEENPSILYISQYKEIAIAEMQRTGIPASIKMAQALLESGAGRSTLANKANNHFGIKCGGEWNGKTFYRKDDDYKNGKLIESCFRKFRSPDESFIAHSNFLAHQNRYAFLFDYDKLDYHNWAHGLKKAGYATDKAYPKKLINLIEKYQLFLLDSENARVAESNAKPSENVVKANVINAKGASSKKSSPHVKKDVNKEEKKERSSSRSKSRSSKRSKSRKSNKTTSTKRSKKENQTKSRRSSSKASNPIFHIVSDGQTMKNISKRYGIKEGSLRLRNRIPRNAEPLVGEKIYLRKKIRLLDQPQYSKTKGKRGRASNDKFIF